LMTLPTVCAAIPALVAVGFCAAVFVAAVFGSTPAFWQGGSLTLSEAAALRDQGEVARLIEAGADPDSEYPLRPDVIATRRATPLEAAVAARRAEIVNLLMREGATMDERSWRRLHCLAVDTGAADVVEAIDAHRPVDAAVASCPE
jgi:hypothetical protein